MNRTQLACYSLMASAFVLAALLMVRTHSLLEQPAHAAPFSMYGDNVNVATGSTPQGIDVVYILDSSSEQLVVYSFNQKGVMEPLDFMNVAQTFTQQRVPGGPARRPAR